MREKGVELTEEEEGSSLSSEPSGPIIGLLLGYRCIKF
jgi:hypothetical protein